MLHACLLCALINWIGLDWLILLACVTAASTAVASTMAHGIGVIHYSVTPPLVRWGY